MAVQIEIIPAPEPESSLMSNDLQEISFVITDGDPLKADLIRSVLYASGRGPGDVVESDVDGRLAVSVFVKTARRAELLAGKLKALNLKGVRLRRKTLVHERWVNAWKEDFKPFSLTKEITVVPLEHQASFDAGDKKVIFLDTALAFGTGLHETTRFMAGLIEQNRSRTRSLIDVGTGTGILAMTAARYGIPEIWALDIDGQSVKVAEKNFRLNRFRPDRLVCTDLKALRTRKTFDFVAANLETMTLIRFKTKLISLVKDGKYLAVSGISRANELLLRDAFASLPLRCLRVKRGRKWLAVLFKKKGGSDGL